MTDLAWRSWPFVGAQLKRAALCVVCVFAWAGSLASVQATTPQTPTVGMIATAHPLATQAGEQMLAAGGNAVDVAVAVSFALSVVEPWHSGLGGGAFMVVKLGDTLETWDSRETAPAAAHRDMFIKRGKVSRKAATESARASGIPGLVRGLIAAHNRYGSLPRELVMAPAIRYAEEGFAATAGLVKALGAARDKLDKRARKIFSIKKTRLPEVGQRIRQPDLAHTLRTVAREGDKGFYEGAIAKELVRSVRRVGGIWTRDDLKAYRAVRRPAVMGSYRGYEIASMGSPSSGGLLLVQMLGVLERLVPQPQSHRDVAGRHRLTEVFKRAYAMRATGLGDADHVSIARSDYVGGAVMDRLAAEVRAAKKATPAEAISSAPAPPREGKQTTHFGVLMANGDAVAMTQTINLTFGSGRVAGRTGVILNNEMDDFSAKPGSPNAFGLVGGEANAIAPGKRPLSSMTPTLVLKEGKAVGIFGTPGGSRIITTTLQTLLGVVDEGLSPAEALAAPRVHHQWLPDRLYVEEGALDGPARQALEALGHEIQDSGPMCNAMVLWRGADGVMRGAADPRGEGNAGGL